MSDFPSTFREWLRDATALGVPAEVVAFAFNLFEQTTEDPRFGVEFVGTDRFELDDPDWACSEVWEPSGGRSLNIPRVFSGADWATCLARMIELVKGVVVDGDELGAMLRSATGVAVGFVDGELVVTHARAP